MSSIFGAGIGFFLVFPILIAQWFGVVGLAKNGRNGAWWCMAVGTGLTTIGSILTPIVYFALMRNSGGFEKIGIYLAIAGGVSGLGSLIFVVGFAIHGMKSRRMYARVEELESVLAAQGEQLSRQDSGKES